MKQRVWSYYVSVTVILDKDNGETEMQEHHAIRSTYQDATWFVEDIVDELGYCCNTLTILNETITVRTFE